MGRRRPMADAGDVARRLRPRRSRAAGRGDPRAPRRAGAVAAPAALRRRVPRVVGGLRDRRPRRRPDAARRAAGSPPSGPASSSPRPGCARWRPPARSPAAAPSPRTRCSSRRRCRRRTGRGWLKLSPRLWGFVSRFWWWLFDHHDQQETRARGRGARRRGGPPADRAGRRRPGRAGGRARLLQRHGRPLAAQARLALRRRRRLPLLGREAVRIATGVKYRAWAGWPAGCGAPRP